MLQKKKMKEEENYFRNLKRNFVIFICKYIEAPWKTLKSINRSYPVTPKNKLFKKRFTYLF